MEKLSKWCTDEGRMRWNLGQDATCPEDKEHCKFLVYFGQQAYCGHCPPRCVVHDLVRSQAGCLFCKHTTKKLTCATCAECLSERTRINFDPVDGYKKKEDKSNDA